MRADRPFITVSPGHIFKVRTRAHIQDVGKT
jgi:hypothetical protein